METAEAAWVNMVVIVWVESMGETETVVADIAGGNFQGFCPSPVSQTAESLHLVLVGCMLLDTI